ncbi:MAG: AbrB/MazE/SpoVT family DNA-binding domain-containing protein [Chloroflexi bacterium]|nr:AbrB/MazE/SpoVT family DNA-binding domain-containing protein [Chloroflexota bacterium]
MSMAKVTVKGQVTIPKEVRQQLGIAEGDFVFFELEDGKATMRRIKRVSLLDFVGAFPATRPFPGKEAVRAEVQGRVAERVAKHQD